MTWSVNGVAGGSATAGTISASGLHQAPAAVPPGGTATIRAMSTAAPSAFDEVTITIVDPGHGDPAPNPGQSEIDLGQSGATTGSAFYVDAISLTNGQGANQPPAATFGANTPSTRRSASR